MKKKLYTIFLIIFLFILFCVNEHLRLNTNIVLKIINPTVFNIDLNGNRKIDDNETICIFGLKSFSSDIKKDFTELSESLGLSTKELIALGYLAEDFSNKTLLEKNVKLKFYDKSDPLCRYADIEINGKNYSDMLIKNGFALKDNKPLNENVFKNKLSEAQKLDLVILNHKNNKYHSPNCKYAQAASDTVTILRKQISAKANPCKICTGGKNKIIDIPPNIAPPPTIITSGSLELFLTDFTKQLVPNKDCISNVCRVVLKEINNSTSTIDMAVYGWESIPSIEKALKNAKSRGVKIRLVTDEKTPDDNYYPDKDKIILLSDTYKTDLNIGSKHQTNMLMHNKFMIFDDKKVITGSMNYSRTGLSGFNANNLILINSTHIAQIYKTEFEQMLSGKFHYQKSKTINNKNIKIGDSTLSVFFSPQDKIAVNEITPLINNAKNYIYIPTFVLTHQGITDALIKAKNRNVDVKIIIDATNTNQKHTKHNLLRQEGIAVKTENYAGKMHMKSMIIDDKYVIAGSMNFSNSGENKNDENLIIIEDTKIARFYKNYFRYLWTEIPDKWLTLNVRAESKDSIGACSDGVDNDHDGKIDYMDESCK